MTDRPTDLPPAESLTALRALIDAIDHEILEKIARRDDLVSRVARLKRTLGTPIRDAGREEALLVDRRTFADQLGVRPDVAESLFRLVLWASRDRQAALKAELPPEDEQKTVAIVGGHGGMGGCLAGLFSDLGHTILPVDHRTALSPTEAARQADVVVISVPITETLPVIAAVGPHVRPEAVLMDVTSIKQAPLDAMLAATPASVVGTHPLFGPGGHSLQGQRMVMVRGRGEAWFDWAKRMFHARGLQIVESTAADHDRMMAIVQVLVHFNTEVLGKTLADLGVPIEATLPYTSPIYLIKLCLAARHFGQSADLYAGIEMSNERTAEVLATFQAAAAEIADIVHRKDGAAFRELFAMVSTYFGDFTSKATIQSSYLIDRMVERA
jgi:chorismate mutase / prephenate dehydrogenase